MVIKQTYAILFRDNSQKFYFQNTKEIEIGGISFFHYDNYYFFDIR